mmetsp:Transcript_59184/g.132677  ORF Transcript_59184/g.132677 Transcript_59184/m.132677 type:complete len:644 (-) Transcript_59184:84-2015(-)
MSRKGWSQRSGQWRVQWTNTDSPHQATFKVDCENGGLTDSTADEWGYWLDDQLERRFGKSWPTKLTANSLNFSQNGLSDKGVQRLVEYLKERRIAVQTLKLFKNSIRDEGAYAIGQLLSFGSPDPLHEVHLSHNLVTEKGVCSILELIHRSKRYPYPTDLGKRDNCGHTPVWLRVEHNLIKWEVCEERMKQLNISWCTAENRDGWQSRSGKGSNSEAAPMICMHHSYANQKDKAGLQAWDTPAASGGKLLLAALHGDGAARQHLGLEQSASGSAQSTSGASRLPAGTESAGARPSAGSGSAPLSGFLPSTLQPEQAGGGADSDGLETDEPCPFYIFLDAQAAQSMLFDEKRLFTFRSILRLCQKGLMPSVDTEEIEADVEKERVIIAITQSVYDSMDAQTQERLGLMYMSDGGFKDMGVIEVIDTEMHEKLERINVTQERRASRELQLRRENMMLLDFSMLWQEQLKVSDLRVLVLSLDRSLCDFSLDLAKERGSRRDKLPAVMMLEEFEACLDADVVCGRGLRDAMQQPVSSTSLRQRGPLARPETEVAFTASLVRRIVLYREKVPSAPPPTEELAALRSCLQEVQSIFTLLRSHVERPVLGPQATGFQVQQQVESRDDCLRTIDKFVPRIQEVLGRSHGHN